MKNKKNIKKTTQKPEDLILYIFANYNNENLTETKLNKLLYFCDFRHYEKEKNPITDGIYINNNYGPTLKNLKPILSKMIRNKKIKPIIETNYYGSPQTRYSVVTDKLEFVFEEEVVHTIKEINGKYRELKPTELSSISHFDAPYLISQPGEHIDYKNILFRDDEFAVSDKEKSEWENFLSADRKSTRL